MFMQAYSTGRRSWLDADPLPGLWDSKGPGRPLFLDMRSSIGLQSVAVKARYLDVLGMIVYQDKARL
jgi:hypothetical protein